MSDVDKVNNEMVLSKLQWSTHMLVEEGLVVHTSMFWPEFEIYKTHVCPDGLPTVVVNMRTITRVRKMTEEEKAECIRNLGHKIEIDMRVYNTESGK